MQLADGDGTKEAERILPDEPMPVGCDCAVYESSLQREGLEPLTIAPGRWRATAEDTSKILEDFELAVADAWGALAAFPSFRKLYTARGMSILVEPSKGEVLRDLFQFVCGVIWHFFVKESFVKQVGCLFLVYLLFHSQQRRHAIVVNVDLLEKFQKLKEECLSRQVFLEVPVILQKMARGEMFSVGIRASYRNLFFDSYGQLLERRVQGPIPNTRAWRALKAQEAQPVQVALPSMGSLPEQIKDYDRGETMSRRVECLTAASATFAETLARAADGAAPTKARKRRRGRMVSDDEEPEEATKPERRLEHINGRWKSVYQKQEQNQTPQVLGLGEDLDAGTSKRLMEVVESKLRAEGVLEDVVVPDLVSEPEGNETVVLDP